jgi:hypothetical protein
LKFKDLEKMHQLYSDVVLNTELHFHQEAELGQKCNENNAAVINKNFSRHGREE